MRASDIYNLLPRSYADAMMNEVATSVAASPERMKRRRWCPWSLHPKQKEFYEDDTTREMMYGGSAGSGKSVVLVASALKYVHVPNYAAIIFRQSYPMLNTPGGVIDLSRQWLSNTPAKFNKGSSRWTWPNNATLTFAHMQHDSDVYNHQGAAYQYIGWDELTQFTKWQYTYLFSRCRRPKTAEGTPLGDVPLRIRSATNPGGFGHVWVKSRFVDSLNPETRKAIAAHRRKFLRAVLDDNPSLDREEYIQELSELDPVTRAQLLRGDWDINDEGLLTWDMIAACRDESTLWPDERPPKQHGDLYIGVDVGRTTHNTVIWVWEDVGDVAWCRVCRVLRHADKPMTFKEQQYEIEKYINLPRVIRCKQDKGGIGYQLAEELEAKYPHIVEGVQLTQGKQGQLGQLMAVRFAERRVRIPHDDTLTEDLQMVEKVGTKNGSLILKTEEGPSGHADRFWAGALGLDGIPLRKRTIPTGVPRGLATNASKGKR